MRKAHGFSQLREEEIQELNVQARLFEHEKTGAELLSLSAQDENKVFGIAFRTPSPNATGVAHILEHSVLCGSRKYPVKEPFVELLKGSLQTFLNAFTFPDKTCYPVASQNVRDFYNLIDVYLDAVFYPRLTPFLLAQEGWHFELENPEDELSFKGVVFNEMKGAYSSPESVLSEYSIQAVFPDTPYAFDSGGDPKVIPDLSFEEFVAYHKKYYHPSNARIYFYGDDDPEERLRVVNEYLKDFEPQEIESGILLQPRLAKPRRLVRGFAAAAREGEQAKGMITVNWLLEETKEIRTNFASRILEYALLGMPASPLRKALIDSGLGSDIAGEGLGTELRQLYFSTGLKGIDPGDADKVEALILETLDRLGREGLAGKTAEAALNTIEFRLRENNAGRFPRGLLLMLRSLTTWLYEGDPLGPLAFEAPLNELKPRILSRRGFLEGLIRRFFLENTHRATLILTPDPHLKGEEEAREKKRLDKARASMAESDLERVCMETRELKRRQETPDPPEALATIPVLSVKDLERQNKPIPLTLRQWDETTVLFHDLSTNGIVYLDVGFDLHALEEAFIPYVPLFARALVETGTDTEDFVSLTQRIHRKTGGIRPRTFASEANESEAGVAWMFLRGKAMAEKTGELIGILRDVLLSARLGDRDRFRQMLLEEKARAEQDLIPKGHQVVNARIRAHFGLAGWVAEQMGGVSYLFFLRELEKRVEKDWEGIHRTLKEIRRFLTNRRTVLLNLTLDQKRWSQVEPGMQGLLKSLPEAAEAVSCRWSPGPPPRFEAMTLPAQVNYVGKGARLYDLGYRFHGSALVITRYLRNSWLWDRIRVQGGAYGAFCLLDRFSGVLSFLSYRDPNLLETLEVFDRSGGVLEAAEITDEELNKAIIGAIGDMDAPMLPDAKGYASMLRHLTGDSEPLRQKVRDEILGTEAADFRDFGEVLKQAAARGIVKVLGSPDAVEEARKKRPGWLKEIHVL